MEMSQVIVKQGGPALLSYRDVSGLLCHTAALKNFGRILSATSRRRSDIVAQLQRCLERKKDSRAHIAHLD
jgi:hypothetical protein